jgi:hypothetical protein
MSKVSLATTDEEYLKDIRYRLPYIQMYSREERELLEFMLYLESYKFPIAKPMIDVLKTHDVLSRRFSGVSSDRSSPRVLNVSPTDTKLPPAAKKIPTTDTKFPPAVKVPEVPVSGIVKQLSFNHMLSPKSPVTNNETNLVTVRGPRPLQRVKSLLNVASGTKKTPTAWMNITPAVESNSATETKNVAVTLRARLIKAKSAPVLPLLKLQRFSSKINKIAPL